MEIVQLLVHRGKDVFLIKLQYSRNTTFMHNNDQYLMLHRTDEQIVPLTSVTGANKMTLLLVLQDIATKPNLPQDLFMICRATSSSPQNSSLPAPRKPTRCIVPLREGRIPKKLAWHSFGIGELALPSGGRPSWPDQLPKFSPGAPQYLVRYNT